MENQPFFVAVALWGIFYGLSVFIPERVFSVIAGITAFVAGVLAFVKVL